MLKSVFLIVSLVLCLWGCGPQTSKPTYQIYLGPTAILPTSLPTTVPTPTSTLVMAQAWTPTPIPTATPLPDEVLAIVVEILDGSTLKVILEGDSLDVAYTVDLIGINPPGNDVADPWHRVAIEQMNHWLSGKAVRLVRDNTRITQGGILPRYLYVDNELVNLRLITFGLAQVEFTEPDRLLEADFQAAEQAAQTNQRGLWGPAPTPTPLIVATATMTTSVSQP